MYRISREIEKKLLKQHAGASQKMREAIAVKSVKTRPENKQKQQQIQFTRVETEWVITGRQQKRKTSLGGRALTLKSEHHARCVHRSAEISVEYVNKKKSNPSSSTHDAPGFK